MSTSTANSKIDFRPITTEDKQVYEKFLAKSGVRGCEFSFANLYLWGRQSISIGEDSVFIFSQFNQKTVYPFPLGEHDVHSAFDSIIADAKARGIACRITGITERDRELLENFYPGRFRYHMNEGSFDYVYSIDDLADLPGKKYDGKRNHLRRFRDAFPHCVPEPITDGNAREALEFIDEWYATRLAENPEADFQMERRALTKAMRDREALGLVGLMLRDGDRVLALTLASRLSEDTFDVHFEKARADVQGAYPAINCALARHIRETHPEVRYLDREEDMGIEGLRRSKRSYHPHHMIKKWWACLLDEEYEY